MSEKLNNAQSLIETIVAIGIMVTAIVAILSIGLTHLVTGGQSRERVVAINLAREGIEIVYAIRNSNWLDPGQSWPYDLTNDDWIINYNSDQLVEAVFSGGTDIEHCTNCSLCQGVNDLTTHCVDNEALFKRMITISAGDDIGALCNNDCEKKIVSTVFWRERENTHTINIETRLTSWR